MATGNSLWAAFSKCVHRECVGCNSPLVSLEWSPTRLRDTVTILSVSKTGRPCRRRQYTMLCHGPRRHHRDMLAVIRMAQPVKLFGASPSLARRRAAGVPFTVGVQSSHMHDNITSGEWRPPKHYSKSPITSPQACACASRPV